MIRENDLLDAIAECQGNPKPNANTCIKLAAYYTILDHVRESSGMIADPGYSSQAYPDPVVVTDQKITYRGDSEFLQSVTGRDAEEIWPIIDELMITLQIVNPRLYASVMRKL